MIPSYLQKHFPFKSNYLTLPNNIKMHYVDEGEGECFLMLHGNPSWSFFYRHLITTYKKNYRVIAPDHIGMGLSDKPTTFNYRLQNHIENIDFLINHLKLKNITLIVHDWGGAIGFGHSIKYPQNIKKIIILNTAAFTSKNISLRINICRTPFLAEQVIRHFNAFALPATFMAVTKRLPREIKQGYLYPYGNYKNRIATARFVQDIPINKQHPSFATLYNIEKNLDKVKCPKMILWGADDFCFDMKFFQRWREIYPQAEHHVFKNAGHYLLEDAPKKVVDRINTFISEKNNEHC